MKLLEMNDDLDLVVNCSVIASIAWQSSVLVYYITMYMDCFTSSQWHINIL